jgi:hypothetical protein
MPTIGLNIRGGGFSNEIVASYVLNELKPRSTLVINESKLAAMLVGGVPRLIYRMKDTSGVKDDDGAFSKHSAVTFADALHHLAPPGAWLYGGNEFGSDRLREQDEWSLRFVERCAFHGRKPLIHNNYMQHPLQGAFGWQQLRASTEAAIQAGGGVGPHLYYYGTIGQERERRPRNSFMVLDELRHTFGGDLPIILTEFGYAEGYDPHAGYKGRISEERYADDTAQAANICRQFDADLLVYLVSEPNTEWEAFNVHEAEVYKRRIAEFNRSIPVTQTNWQPRRIVPTGNFNVNIRASASATAPIVGRVPAGGVVADLDTNTEWSGEWHRVRLNGVIGFVSAAFVTVERIPDPPAQTPVFSDLPVAELLGTPELRRQHAQLLRLYADYVEHGAQET